MSLDASPLRCSEPEGMAHFSVITGTAGTVSGTGKGVTFSYTSTGVYKLTFKDRQGAVGGASLDFSSATMTDLKGYTAVLGTFDSTGTIVSVSVYNASSSAADLTAGQFLYLGIFFKRAQATL